MIRWSICAVLVVACACSSTKAAEPSPPPGGDPTVGLAVPAGPVLFQPEQIIFPPEDFPLPSTEITRDAPQGTRGWVRQFDTPTSADFRWFALQLFVLEPDVTAMRFIADNGCGSVSWPGQQPKAADLDAPSAGDGARACRYGFADGARVLYLATGYRNVGILVATQPRRTEVGDGLAVEWLSALAREQIAIIGRVMTVARY